MSTATGEQSVAAKVYSAILKKRLRHWSEEALLEVQNGFRGSRGCADAIFVLRRIIDQHVIKNKQLHICFIDIAKAYDSIDRDTAWNTILHMGAPRKIVRLLRDMHQGTSSFVVIPTLTRPGSLSVDNTASRLSAVIRQAAVEH